MDEFEELVDFLNEKGTFINTGFKSVRQRISGLTDEQIKNKKEILKELELTAFRYKRMLKVMQYLTELSGLQTTTENKTRQVNIWDDFLTGKITEIINGTDKFNIEHPLFGYKAFYEKLIDSYANNGQYEKCGELKEYYMLMIDEYEKSFR